MRLAFATLTILVLYLEFFGLLYPTPVKGTGKIMWHFFWEPRKSRVPCWLVLQSKMRVRNRFRYRGIDFPRLSRQNKKRKDKSNKGVRYVKMSKEELFAYADIWQTVGVTYN